MRPRSGRIEISFAIVGEAGAVELRVWAGEADPGLYMAPVSSLGFEVHERVAATDARHANCWLLNGPCRHDGTSLWASEYWLPNLMQYGTDWLWPRLEREYAERFPEPPPHA